MNFGYPSANPPFILFEGTTETKTAVRHGAQKDIYKKPGSIPLMYKTTSNGSGECKPNEVYDEAGRLVYRKSLFPSFDRFEIQARRYARDSNGNILRVKTLE